ncbi:MAG: sulfite exporter TauE/SafE family protein [Armatimonadota bacterium]|nr:sulfite exporter TauE/SafE family protein [Armatimonadota bacterium]
MNFESLIPLALTGLVAGISAGLFGIGGGIIIVPALVYLLGFSQHKATGTSLAILLPPVGLAAVLEYYRNKNVDIPAAIVIALMLFLGGWVGARIAHKLSEPHLKLAFGVFAVVMGIYTIITALQKINRG